ncbi:MAG: sulfotransferase [Phycisphaerales bacterium]
MQPLTDQHGQRLAEARQLIDRGRPQDAIPILTELRRKTDHPDVALNLGRAQFSVGEVAAARMNLERVIKTVPTAIGAHLLIAATYRSEDNLPAALKAIDTALTLMPGEPQAVAQRAQLQHMMGDYQGGLDTLAPAIEQGTDDPGILFQQGRLLRVTGELDEAEQALNRAGERLVAGEAKGVGAGGRARQSIAGARQRNPMAEANLLYELAAVYDAMGNYDRAWQCASQANALLPQRFNPAAHDQMITRIVEGWTPDACAATPVGRSGSDVPVFILGMPRSGTSLVEQILGSHPQIAAGGERSSLWKLVGELEPHQDALPTRIENPSAITQSALDKAARAYVKDLRSVDKSADRVTDKQPFNFLHIGLIAKMFPNARIIHCRRNPFDVAVSCFMQSFMGSVWFSTSLQGIAVFYQTYERLMHHWTQTLSTELGIEILDVPYEELTADQDAWSRKIVEYAGVPWDDACLRFHESDRTVYSASMDQVRKPMYRTSVDRWKNYAPWLQAIMAPPPGSEAAQQQAAQAAAAQAGVGDLGIGDLSAVDFSKPSAEVVDRSAPDVTATATAGDPPVGE